MRQWMQETLYETADAGDTLSDRRCRRHSMGQQMHNYIYKTADTGLSPPDNKCRSECY